MKSLFKIRDINKCIVIFFLVFYTNGLFSQSINFKNFTSNEGLPSSSIYSILQDKNGFIWVATDKGLSRFDGNDFYNFDLKSGLPSNYVLSMDLYNDTLILGTQFNFCSIYNSTTLKKTHINNLDTFKNDQILINGNFLYSIFKHTYVVIYNLKTNKIVSGATDTLNVAYCISKTSDHKILEGRSNGLFVYDSIKNHEQRVNDLSNKKIFAISNPLNNKVIVYADKKLYVLKDLNVIDSISLPNTFINIRTGVHFNSDESIMLFNSEGDFYKITKNNKSYVFNNLREIFYPKKAIINYIYEDKIGNIWLSTFNNGIYCLYNSFSQNYSENDGLDGVFVNDIYVDENENIFLATQKGIYTKSAKSKKFIRNSNNSFVYRIDKFDNKLVFSVSDVNKKLKNDLFTDIVVNKNIELFKIRGRRVFLNNQIMAIAYWDNGFEIKDLKTKDSCKILLDKGNARLTKFFSLNDSVLWVGSNKGLYDVNIRTKKVSKVSLINFVVTDILRDDNNRIFVATENGLYLYKNNIWLKNAINFNATISNFSCLSKDLKNRNWFGTNKGIIIENNGVYYSEIFGYPKLLSNEVSCLFFDSLKNKMYVGSNLGLSVIDVTKMDNQIQTPPNVILLKVYANDSIIDPSKRLALKYENQNLKLNFTAIELLNYKKPIFRYKLDNNNWVITFDKSLTFSDMSPGEHTITLQSSLDNVKWGNSCSYNFEILYPIYKTSRFYILVLLSCLIILFFAFQIRIYYINKKNQLKFYQLQLTDELKYQALSAAVNPHFIFNTLGAIQSYITSHNTFKASDYIAKFASLIRITLHFAGEKLIKLEEEIKRVSIYLELEKLRCGDKLNYKIDISENLDKNISIPNMLIQPLIENAIIHGILKLPNNTPGNILVKITQLNDLIEIIVEDDGVGYDNKAKSKHGYKSIGIDNLKKRLSFFKNSSFSITNKASKTPTTSGTIVRITIQKYYSTSK